MSERTARKSSTCQFSENLPRVRGVPHRNSGLDAHEKLPSVEAKAKMATPNLHLLMMSNRPVEVKFNWPAGWMAAPASFLTASDVSRPIYPMVIGRLRLPTSSASLQLLELNG